MNLSLPTELNDILSYAREEAMRLGSYLITTDHLLLGLLRHAQNEACQLLQKNNIALSTLKEVIDSHEGATEMIPPDQADKLAMSKASEAVLKGMYLEAKSLREIIPTAKHLLLALLLTQEGAGVPWLQQQGISHLGLRAQLGGAVVNRVVLPRRPQEVPMEASAPRPESKTPVLDAYAFDLTAAATDGRLDPVVRRDKEIDRLAQILGRRKKNNPILIGEPGVGKSAIVEGLALRIAQKQASPTLMGRRILSLDIGSVVAGTKYRGQFEERMKSLLAEVRKNPHIILFIDEIHTLVGAGGATGSLDAANMLKPALARGEMQCIGATTLDEYREFIEKDGALERRFQKIMVEPTNAKETLEILQHIAPKYEAHHKVIYTQEAMEACVRLSQRYITDRCLPDKAIDVMDEVGSRVHIEHVVVPSQVAELEASLEAVVAEKRAALAADNMEQAVALREKERNLTVALTSARKEWEITQEQAKERVTAERVAEVVSMMTTVPVSRVSETETGRLLHMAEVLKAHLIGQDDAIDAMVRAIQRNRAGLKDPNKPIGTFIFLGPTGVGKTQLAKLVANYMFDSPDSLVRIDMSEYMEKFAVSRLIGAPPGYVGYDEGGQLTERIRRKPYAVVLLDEIEKAHQDIFNLLLQVFDEGRLTDSNGRHVDFRNTIIIMTSNIGSRELKEFGGGVGFATASAAHSVASGARSRALIEKALGKIFTPEFLNRVDEQILFNALDKDAICQIIEIELADLYQRIEQAGYQLEITAEAKQFVAEKGFDPQYGARPLKRAMQRLLEDPLSEAIICRQMAPGTLLRVGMNEAGTDTVVLGPEA